MMIFKKIKHKMDADYINIFNMNDALEVYYYELIMKINVNILYNVLIKDLEIMNFTLISPDKWKILKYELLKYENYWKIDVFKWDFDGIHIDWDVLENKPTRYFQIHDALEACWEKPLAPIWDEID